MAQTDDRLHYDFTALVTADLTTLLSELADTHAAIANLCVSVAFLRQEETRGVPTAKEQRLEFEGLRDAFTEKKWLLKTLLDHQEREL